MNLIEQFGGYEKVKSIRDINIREFDGDASGVTIHYMGKSITQEDLEKSLLEYRRQHNIFEVGDDVVYEGEAGLEAVFQIETLTKTGKPKTVKTKRFGNFPCRYCAVRHATPEEIVAGKRL